MKHLPSLSPSFPQRETRPLTQLLFALTLALAPLSASQDWRGSAIASFDLVWETVSETFYEPGAGGLDWSAVRDELRPRAQAAESPDAVREIIRQMLARLRRSHFTLLSASAADAMPGSAIVPIDVRVSPEGVIVTRVWPKSSADRQGLRPGDVLLGVDHETAADWIPPSGAGSDPRAVEIDVWRRVTRLLHGVSGSAARLRIKSPGREPREVEVVRGDEAGEPVTLGNLPPLHVVTDTREVQTPARRRVGVIAFNVWMAPVNAVIDGAVDRFRKDAGLVIDLRGNPGGLILMMSNLAGHVFDTPVVLGQMQTRTNKLTLSANPRRSTADGRRVEPFAGPVAILVDQLTASASECFAGALQSLGRARVFGQQTMGQALPASTKALPNGDVLMYAIGDFVTSSGRRMEGAGVTPDEVQPLSIEALAAGRDLTFEAALRWIDAQPARR